MDSMGHFCDKCNRIFRRKENMEYHINHGSCIKRVFPCKACDKSYASKSGMYRHMRNSCIIKKQEEEEKENILERLVRLENSNRRLEQDNNDLKKEIITLKETVVSTKNTTNNRFQSQTNNTNKGIVINGNVTLVGYGKEDLSKLVDIELLKILRQGYNSTVKLTEAVHFNPKYPENHNIFISNMKNKYAMMFDGTEWTLTTKEDLINMIYDDKKNYIEENLDKFVESLQPSRKRALVRWLDTEDNDGKIKEIKDSIKILLYNKRKMIESPMTKNLVQSK